MSHRSSFAILAFAAAGLAAGSAQAATIRVLVGPGDTQTFVPANVTIRVGDTIEWANENRGGMSHNVVADDNSFTSGAVAAGPWTYRHTFTAVGANPYYCAPHGGTGGAGMSGVVDVTDAIEVAHGSDMNDDLLGAPDRYRIGQKPYSSYEVVVDPLAGNAALELHRLAGTTTTVLQSGEAVSSGIDQAQSLRWQNATAAAIDTDRVRVSSSACGTSCGAPDLYRIRVYDTTLSFSRFNQSGTQASVLILQNSSNTPINATLYFWNASGTLLNSPGTVVSNIAAKATVVQPVSTINGGALVGTSGSVTISHTGRYGDLSGKVVAVEPATGFSFDTASVVHPR
jgi:plastocyanin